MRRLLVAFSAVAVFAGIGAGPAGSGSATTNPSASTGKAPAVKVVRRCMRH